MLIFRAFVCCFAFGVVAALWESRPGAKKPSREQREGVSVTTIPLKNGGEVVHFRGGFDDVMEILDPSRRSEKPALPEDLDVETLQKDSGGCPHCGQRSFVGEGQWRYAVLSCTRQPWDNTTTYLARCKGCLGLMKVTADHND